VVYSKPPFGGPEHVLKYLARYTHRVAISNGRLLGLDSGQVPTASPRSWEQRSNCNLREVSPRLQMGAPQRAPPGPEAA